MEQTTHRQMSESFRLGAVLALTGGFLDAYTYLIRGGVFANAQTGNIVLLGVRLMEGDWGGAGHYLVPILAFAAGVLAAELIRGRFRGAQALHWRQITVAAELLLLAAVAFLPAALDNAANVLVAFVCAVQVESFRKVNGNAFATTMCTGNLRSGTELLCRYFQTGEGAVLRKAMQYFGIILFFLIGAVIGFFLTQQYGVRSVYFCCGLLFLVFLILFIKIEEKSGECEHTSHPRKRID